MVLRFQVTESQLRDRLGCSPALEPLQQDTDELLILQPDAVFLGFKQCLLSAIAAEHLQCCGDIHTRIYIYRYSI